MLYQNFYIIFPTIILCGCSALNTPDKYNQPQHLLFNIKDKNTYPITVERDNKICDKEDINKQSCPIKLYIDDFKAGEFYINNTSTYYLKENEYTFTAKNCKSTCKNYEIKFSINKALPNQKLILSLDKNEQLIIIKKQM